MSALSDPRFWSVLGASALTTLVLARVASRMGWGDAPAPGTAERKLQLRAVPRVGAVALLVGLAFAPAWGDRLGPASATSRVLLGSGPLAFGMSMLAVVAVGAWDDRRAGGLAPLPKLGLQAAALAPLAVGFLLRAWADGPLVGIFGVLLFLGAGLLALNLTNTFDNADGAVASVAALGFAVPVPWVSAACLGFLPFNLDARLPWNRASRAPTAYLGDSGSYVIALLVLVVPGAWPVLWIPLLDLLRLSGVRLRAGSWPWIGDRRHLAHRLQARVRSPAAVAGILALLTLPGSLGSALAAGMPGALPGGLALSAVLYAVALALAPPGTAERPAGNGGPGLRAP